VEEKPNSCFSGLKKKKKKTPLNRPKKEGERESQGSEREGSSLWPVCAGEPPSSRSKREPNDEKKASPATLKGTKKSPHRKELPSAKRGEGKGGPGGSKDQRGREEPRTKKTFAQPGRWEAERKKRSLRGGITGGRREKQTTELATGGGPAFLKNLG